MNKRIIAILMVITLSISLAGCSKKDDSTSTTTEIATYEGVGKGLNGDIKVSVEINNEKISKVTVLEHSETEGISDAAIEKIPANIVEKNSTDVDSVAGATLTSNGIKEAVDNALANVK